MWCGKRKVFVLVVGQDGTETIRCRSIAEGHHIAQGAVGASVARGDTRPAMAVVYKGAERILEVRARQVVSWN